MEYHLIVHLDDVRFESRNMNASSQARERAHQTLSTIDTILEQPNTLQIPFGTDPRRIPSQIKSGDHVTLYGGRHGYCLSGTLIALQLRGIKAEYHPDGYI